jgi:hypothetical protein
MEALMPNAISLICNQTEARIPQRDPFSGKQKIPVYLNQNFKEAPLF